MGKIIITLCLMSFVNLAYSQSFLLKEGEVEFDYGYTFLSVKIADSLVIEDEAKSDAARYKGYFLYFLPPKFKMENRTLEKLIDLSEINPTRINGDTFSYRIHYEYRPSYKSQVISNEYVSRSCASADVSIAFAIEFEEVPAEFKSKKVKLSKSDLEKGKKRIKIDYTYQKLVDEPKIIVTRTFNEDFTDNLAFNKIIFLNGKYWSKFRPVICCSSYQDVDLFAIQKFLKDNDYQVEINGVLDEKTESALFLFQKENELPVGFFNIETLSKMGIEDDRVRRYEHYIEN